MDISRILWAGLRGAIIGGLVGITVYGIRYTIWKDRVPTAIGTLRWPIAIVIGIALIAGEASIGIPIEGSPITAFVVYLIAQALKAEPAANGTPEAQRGSAKGSRLWLVGLLVLLVGASVWIAWAKLWPSQWVPYSSTTGRFSVLAPVLPTEEKESLATPAGPLEMHTFHFGHQDQSLWLAVAYSDYPSSILIAGPDAILNGSRDGAVANVRGRLLSERRISLDDHPGREILIETKERAIVRARIYLVKQRLYQVMAVATKAQSFSKETGRFFESFRVLSN